MMPQKGQVQTGWSSDGSSGTRQRGQFGVPSSVRSSSTRRTLAAASPPAIALSTAIDADARTRKNLAMDLGVAIFSIITLVLGAGLTYLTQVLTTRSNNRRDDIRDHRAETRRKAAAGREHAAKALDIIRKARDESWKRSPEKGSFDIDLDDLQLDVAQAEIDLIPDPILQPRLSGVIGLVRFPWTLANSSYSEGPPVETQRRGLYLLREALAAYMREEPTPTGVDELAKLTEADEKAHEERDEFEAEWEAELKKRHAAAAKTARSTPTNPRRRSAKKSL